MAAHIRGKITAGLIITTTTSTTIKIITIKMASLTGSIMVRNNFNIFSFKLIFSLYLVMNKARDDINNNDNNNNNNNNNKIWESNILRTVLSKISLYL